MRGRMLAVCLQVALLLVLGGGCGKKPAPPKDAGTPVVTVSQPIVRKVTDYVDFTGRTDSPNAVDIRPRVTGYLTKMPFKEGDFVKKNDLLFEVDPRPYQASYDRANGDLILQKAKYKLAVADNVRAKSVAKMNPGAISRQDLDKYQAQEEEAGAAVKASEANLESYKLNLDFCQVISPIDGRVSRYLLTLGNLANQDMTVLTSVVSVDPMYVYFDVDERTVLRLRDLVNSGKLRPLKAGSEEFPVLMGLANESGFPHKGSINFINNKIDPLTGTITVRGVFKNPKPAEGVYLISPGMFVRVRLPVGEPHPAVLVSQKALGLDQGLKFVYIVEADNKVQYRRVTTGQPQSDGLIAIDDGVKPDEWVVVSGLQLVRQGMEVEKEEKPMPTTGPARGLAE